LIGKLFCSGLRRHLLPVISGAVENSVDRQWKFDEFFPHCESLQLLKPVVVFSLVTADYYHVYISRDATYVVVVVVVVI